MTATLRVVLQKQDVGIIHILNGDRTIFEFKDDYISMSNVPILSQAYLDKEGKPFQPERSYQRRLPPWFSNLLPEGALRSYLANMWGVSIQREALLLQKLGKDLPGAVEIHPMSESITDQDFETTESPPLLHFSLAGVQMKFSARLLDHNRLTIPSDGTGGGWILKFPSLVYQAIPENEAAIMNLAKLCGINVPEFNLYDLDKISGIPEKILSHNAKFFAIKRFDRTDTGTKIHMEDFCQIYNLYPEEKYDKASYANIANTILGIAGEESLIEFIRRLTFSILIGNGDMHLKNWSILYKDGTSPTIAPAYDLLSTVPYIPQDKLALTLSKEKKFTDIKLDHFIKLAQKIQFPASVVTDVVHQTTTTCRQQWLEVILAHKLPEFITTAIHSHIKSLAL